MTWPEVMELFDYWGQYPPENEVLTILTMMQTVWKPPGLKPMTAEQHQESLEKRWATGQALSPKQMLDVMGGKISAPGAENGPYPTATPGGASPASGIGPKFGEW